MVAKGLTQSQGQLLLSVLFAAGVPAFFVVGRLADRLPLVPLLLSVIGGFVFSLLLLTVVTGLYAVVAVTLLLGFVIHGLFPAADTYLLASLPDRHRASAYAAYSAAMMVLQAGGSWAVGTLTDMQLSFDAIFGGLALGLAAVLVTLLFAHRAGRLPSRARA
jgi:MFS family permease